MNTNDALLIKMIEKDMQHKGISELDYSIVGDFVVDQPQGIEVKSNEVVYICYFAAITESILNFEVALSSGTAVVRYTPKNTSRLALTAEVSKFESPQISSHWSNVLLSTPYPPNFRAIVRYVKVVYNLSRKKNETH